MKGARILLGATLILREILRSPLTVTLLFVIPVVFFGVVAYTTSTDPMVFGLPSVSHQAMVSVDQRQASLVVIGSAAVGFLAAFLMMSVMQRNAPAHRRLVLGGQPVGEILLAKALVLGVTAGVVALFVGVLLRFWFEPLHGGVVLLGLFSIGLVYGAYGMLVGSAARRDLEGILLVVLLANIDAGWLQNPVYYTNAPNSEFIRTLPAFYPVQAAIIGSFTDHAAWGALLRATLYSLVLGGAAFLLYAGRMRVRAPRVLGSVPGGKNEEPPAQEVHRRGR